LCEVALELLRVPTCGEPKIKCGVYEGDHLILIVYTAGRVDDWMVLKVVVFALSDSV
jgi:hypothetical protein